MRWRDCLDYLGGTDIITSVLIIIRGTHTKSERKTMNWWKQRKKRYFDVGPRAKEWRQPLELHKARQWFSPRAFRRNQPSQHLHFSLVRLILDVWPPDWRKNFMFDTTMFVVICYRTNWKLIHSIWLVFENPWNSELNRKMNMNMSGCILTCVQ